MLGRSPVARCFVGRESGGRRAVEPCCTGGAAAFEACSQDASCAGAVDLDGTLWTEVRPTGLSTPRLLLQHAPTDTCDEFCKRAAADFATVMGTADAEQLSVAGTTHPNFSDAGLMWGIANGITLGAIDAHRMTLITRDMVRSFLDVHLLGASVRSCSHARCGRRLWTLSGAGARTSGDMGIDGFSFMLHEPIQVKQSSGVGRNVVDNFETAVKRSGKEKGYIVAFSFGKGGHEEAARVKHADGLTIELLKVADLLEGRADVVTPETGLFGRRVPIPEPRAADTPPSVEELVASDIGYELGKVAEQKEAYPSN